MANNGFINTITTAGFLIILFAVLTGKAIDLSEYIPELYQGFIYGIIVASIIFIRRKDFKRMIVSLFNKEDEN